MSSLTKNAALALTSAVLITALCASSVDAAIFIEVTPPTVSIVSPADGSYNNTGSVTVTWVVGGDYSGVDQINVSIDGGTPIVAPVDTLSYTFDALPDGSHMVNVTAVDGTTAVAYDEVTIIVSTVLPTITTDPASPIYTNDDSVEVFVHMTSAVPMTTGNMSTYIDGTPGEHYELWGMDGQMSHGEYMLLYPWGDVNVYYFTVNDTAGNSRTVGLTIYRDIAPPTVQIISPVTGSYNNTGSVLLVWQAHDGGAGIDHFEIYRDGSKVANVDAGTTSYQLSLEEGHEEIEVKVFDKAGNSASASVSVIEDRTGPLIGITSPANNSANSTGSVTVVWQGANPLSGISHYIVSIDDEMAVTVAASVHQYAFDDLADGPHTVVVTAVDNAMNEDSDSVTFTVDKTTPEITSFSPTSDGTALSTVVAVTFSEEMKKASLSILVNGVATTDYAWEGNTVTVNPTLVEGTEYTITVSGEDLVGNSVTKTWTFNTTSSSPSGGNFDGSMLIVVAVIVLAAFAAVLLAFKRARTKRL